MTDVRTLLARNMKYFRKIQRISQTTLAARAGCSTTFIGNIEIKKCFPSPENIDRIARALDVKQSDLFMDNVELIVPAAATKAQLKKEINEILGSKILATIKSAIEEL
jgi:transcriptional regulator with XRE-family HTH domain